MSLIAVLSSANDWREKDERRRRDERRERVARPRPPHLEIFLKNRRGGHVESRRERVSDHGRVQRQSGHGLGAAWLTKGAAWPSQTSYLAGFAELLKARSAVLDAHDCAGFTPLHCAAYVDAPTEVCESLLRRGATRSLRADDGALAEDLAKNGATRRSLRRMCIREFDLSFQRTYLEESDDDTESKRPKRKGFSADRMPGEYHNCRERR